MSASIEVDMTDLLGERQAAILRAVVDAYVRNGEPVGSKHVVDRGHFDVSSATVRNEMARLEEMGYLAQPHTSAGRIPTNLAYRFIVDGLKAPRRLTEGQQRALENELDIGADPANPDELLRRASDVASRFTKHAAAVLARRVRATRLRRLELFRVTGRTAMLILIAENGSLQQRMIACDVLITDTDIEALAARLNEHLSGAALEDAMRAADTLARSGPPIERPLIEGVASALQTLLAGEEHVFVGGAANLAGADDFERETLARMYEALERQTAVLELLASAMDEPLTVRIGSEIPDDEFRSCSVVIANFSAGGPSLGSIGVIGPMRMDYQRVISTANAVARVLEGALGTQDPETT